MLEHHIIWPAALLLGLGSGCAHAATPGAPDESGTELVLTDDSSPSAVYDAATHWIEQRALAHDRRKQTALPRSYPEASDELGQRHYLYDAALVLIWATATERHELARALVDELIELQTAHGRWPDLVELDGSESQPTHPAGVAAWVAYALAYASRNLDIDRARTSAIRAARHLMDTRISGPNKCGELVRSRLGTDPIAVTEHQLDTVQLLVALDMEPEARTLLSDTRTCLWISDEQRFATAATPSELVADPALDAAGGWGALLLDAAGHPSLARESLDYTIDAFGIGEQTLVGFRPTLTDDQPFVFFEGSLGVALAAHRLDRQDVANAVLSATRRAVIVAGGGVPYASKSARGFSEHTSVASTIWFLLVDREVRLGQRAPIFDATAFDMTRTPRPNDRQTPK